MFRWRCLMADRVLRDQPDCVCGDMLLYACRRHDRFITSDEVTTTKTCPIRDDRGPHGMCGELLVRDVECPNHEVHV